MNERQRILFRLLVLPFLVAILLPFTFRYWMMQNHLVKVYYFAVAFLMSFGLMPLMYKLGIILGMTDQPGGRHIHLRETPRTGGIALYITFVATLNIVTQPPPEFKGIFWASSIIALTGILDDIKRLPALVKLLGQILATAIVIRYGIALSFIPDHAIGHCVSVLFTALWIIGITNAYNCIDGLDGLAGGIALIVLGFFAFLANSLHDNFMLIACLLLLGALVGFLPYNFRYKKRALLFLGDTGSNLLGFLLATFSIYGTWGMDKGIDLAIPILLLMVPIADMIMTTITRIVEGKIHSVKEWFEYGGNDHIHYRLIQVGFSPKISVLLIFLFTFVMGLISYLVKNGDTAAGYVAILIGVLASFNFFGLVVYQSWRENNVNK